MSHSYNDSQNIWQPFRFLGLIQKPDTRSDLLYQCLDQESNVTHSVQVVDILVRFASKISGNLFDSLVSYKNPTRGRIFCTSASTRNRTWNNGLEVRSYIHLTIEACYFPPPNSLWFYPLNYRGFYRLSLALTFKKSKC